MSAGTLVSSKVLMIPAEAVREIFSRDSAFARAVVAELALRFRDMVRARSRIKSCAPPPSGLPTGFCRQRLASGHTGHLILPFEKRLLASLLGMTPENLSRGFATLAEHGLTTEGQAIIIRDRRKLQRLARENPLIEEIASSRAKNDQLPAARRCIVAPSTPKS